MKKLIVFDLDGTLAESKAPLDAEMATLLGTLLGIVKVAVISGGDWPQFENQVLANLPHDERLKHLYLLPTCGTRFYQYTSIQVRDPHESKRVIEAIVDCLNGVHTGPVKRRCDERLSIAAPCFWMRVYGG